MEVPKTLDGEVERAAVVFKATRGLLLVIVCMARRGSFDGERAGDFSCLESKLWLLRSDWTDIRPGTEGLPNLVGEGLLLAENLLSSLCAGFCQLWLLNIFNG